MTDLNQLEETDHATDGDTSFVQGISLTVQDSTPDIEVTIKQENGSKLLLTELKEIFILTTFSMSEVIQILLIMGLITFILLSL